MNMYYTTLRARIRLAQLQQEDGMDASREIGVEMIAIQKVTLAFIVLPPGYEDHPALGMYYFPDIALDENIGDMHAYLVPSQWASQKSRDPQGEALACSPGSPGSKNSPFSRHQDRRSIAHRPALP